MSAEEYPIEKLEVPPHGNTKTGLPFHKMKVGDSFRVPPEDYARTSSARAHYQKKKGGRFSSRSVRDGKTVIGYVFTREE